MSRTNCPLCGRRAKRPCSVVGLICPACCGANRSVAFGCSPDCETLREALEAAFGKQVNAIASQFSWSYSESADVLPKYSGIVDAILAMWAALALRDPYLTDEQVEEAAIRWIGDQGFVEAASPRVELALDLARDVVRAQAVRDGGLNDPTVRRVLGLQLLASVRAVRAALRGERAALDWLGSDQSLSKVTSANAPTGIVPSLGSRIGGTETGGLIIPG